MNLKNKNQNKILEFKNVKVKYHTPEKEILAIKNLTFDVYSEEFVTILDSSAQNFETIIFSAGKIGYQVETNPHNLEKILKNVKFSDIIV